MMAPWRLESKHLARSGLVRMDPLGNFAVMAMAAQMTVETGVCYCSDNTAEVSHELLGQAMDGWMWRWRRTVKVDRPEPDGTVIVMGDDTKAALGEQCFPRRWNSPILVAREAGDSGCWSPRLVRVLCCTETLAAVSWKIEASATGLSPVWEEQLPLVAGAKDFHLHHPCLPLLHFLVARFCSNAAAGPDDCLFPSRSVVPAVFSSPICFGQVSARLALRCYLPALSKTKSQKGVSSFDRLSVLLTSVLVDRRNRGSRPALPA